MKTLQLGIITTLLVFLCACGGDTEDTSLDQAPEQSPQGILSNQQQQALDAARDVEQTLLNAAEERKKELEARLLQQ